LEGAGLPHAHGHLSELEGGFSVFLALFDGDLQAAGETANTLLVPAAEGVDPGQVEVDLEDGSYVGVVIFYLQGEEGFEVFEYLVVVVQVHVDDS
jgi:hypothetical protein